MAKALKQSVEQDDRAYQQLREVVARRAETLDKLQTVEGTIITKAEALSILKRVRATRASEFVLHLGVLAHGEGQFSLFTSHERREDFYWAVFGNQVEGFVTQQLNVLYSHLGPGLSKSEKTQRAVELAKELESLEVEEERLIRSIEADGTHNVFRRGDANLHAVLDVQPDGSFDRKRAAAHTHNKFLVGVNVNSLWEKVQELKLALKAEKGKRTAIEQAAPLNEQKFVAAQLAHCDKKIARIEAQLTDTRTQIEPLEKRRNVITRLADRIEQFVREHEQREENASRSTGKNLLQEKVPAKAKASHSAYVSTATPVTR
ncbi:MAG: hypothetical protein HY348_07360 [Nitrospira defluvii]|nr:hypothetical protein [Nitrospira defluvii]